MSELKARKGDIKLVTANQVFQTRTTTGQDKTAIFFPAPHSTPTLFPKNFKQTFALSPIDWLYIQSQSKLTNVHHTV